MTQSTSFLNIKLSPNFKNFLVGLLILALMIAVIGLFGYAITGILGFILASIICSGGVSLVVWVPLLCIVGALATIMIKLLKKLYNLMRHATSENKNIVTAKTVADTTAANGPLTNTLASQVFATPAPPSNIELALITYITDARNTGTMGDEIIRLNLKNSGWSDAFIDSAFRQCEPKI